MTHTDEKTPCPWCAQPVDLFDEDRIDAHQAPDIISRHLTHTCPASGLRLRQAQPHNLGRFTPSAEVGGRSSEEGFSVRQLLVNAGRQAIIDPQSPAVTQLLLAAVTMAILDVADTLHSLDDNLKGDR